LLLVPLLLAGPALISCGSSHSSGQAGPSKAPVSAVGKPSPAATTRAPASDPTSAPASTGTTYYVSIGDSYAAGYEPIKNSLIGHTTTEGFAYQLAADTTLRGKRLKLVNFGCGGVTSGGLLEQKGCLSTLEGPGSPLYPNQTQSQAALDFIQNHPGQVGLVTVSIGGNDITACARAADLTGCMKAAMPALASNLDTFLGLLHTLAGPDTLVVGLTYPDVLLGGDLSKEPLSQALAPYGTIPVSVARVCQLTYFCSQNDIHPRDGGYKVIADLVAAVLPKS
jgi:lysophospholipase L1-like esterase